MQHMYTDTVMMGQRHADPFATFNRENSRVKQAEINQRQQKPQGQSTRVNSNRARVGQAADNHNRLNSPR